MAENTMSNPGVNAPALSITLDDGSRHVPIFNLYGEQIGEFKFRPTDIGIANRFQEKIEEFSKLAEPLEKVNINADGTVDEEENTAEAIEAFNEAEARLFKLVDYIFGGNASEAFFGHMHPFSPVSDNFYCMLMLEKLGEFIGQQLDVEMPKVNASVSKYTSKYAPKKRSRK